MSEFTGESLDLYATNGSNYSASVKIALNYKQLSYRQITPPGGGYQSDEYKAINPMGTIPALVTRNNGREVILSESQVILEYLEQRYTHPPLMFPMDAIKNAQLRFTHRLHDLYVEPCVRSLFTQMDPSMRDQYFVNEKYVLFDSRLLQLESICDINGPYIFGEQFTLAECYFPPTFLIAETMAAEFNQDFNLDRFPKLKRWWDHIRNNDYVKSNLQIVHAATILWMDKKRS